MGRPMYVNSDDESSTQTAAKVDRTAAASRSPIRRQPARRRSPVSRRQTPVPANSDRDDSHDPIPAAFLPDRPNYRVQFHHDESLQALYRHQQRAVRHPQQRRRATSPRASQFERILTPNRAQAASRNQALAAARTLRDQTDRAEARLNMLQSALTTQPDDAMTAEGLLEEEQAIDRANAVMPSPPASFDSGNVMTRQPSNASDELMNPVTNTIITPGFPPAREAHRNRDQTRLAHQAYEPYSPPYEPRVNGPRQLTPEGEPSWTAPYPPLSRYRNHPAQRETRPTSREEAGDRARSPNSTASDVEDGAWDTLFTTIEPDEHLPSAESSFTSATATQSTRLSRSSSQAPTTSSTSRRAEGQPSQTTNTSSASQRSPLDMTLDINHPQYNELNAEGRRNMRSIIHAVQLSRAARDLYPSPARDTALLRSDTRILELSTALIRTVNSRRPGEAVGTSDQSDDNAYLNDLNRPRRSARYDRYDRIALAEARVQDAINAVGGRHSHRARRAGSTIFPNLGELPDGPDNTRSVSVRALMQARARLRGGSGSQHDLNRMVLPSDDDAYMAARRAATSTTRNEE